MGRVVKIIVTPVGLVSEAIHARRDERRPSEDLEEDARGGDKAGVSHSGDQAGRKASAYVEVSPEVADSFVIGSWKIDWTLLHERT